MYDIVKRGKYVKIIEVIPDKTFFVAQYSNNKVVKGTGLDNTGWDQLPNGILRLKYVLSTGHIINIPRYKAYLHLVEASMSIDKNGGLNNKNYHYVYVKGIGNKRVYVHRIALRDDPNLAQKIGNVKVYTEEVPSEMTSSWKMSNH